MGAGPFAPGPATGLRNRPARGEAGRDFLLRPPGSRLPLASAVSASVCEVAEAVSPLGVGLSAISGTSNVA